jgi:mono/diheme cytochrome c family protein
MGPMPILGRNNQRKRESAMAKKKTFVWLNDGAANGVIPGKTQMPFFALLLIAPVLVALAILTSTTIATVEAASADAAEETTFKSSCAMCHGADGSGDTAVGKSMKIPDLHSAQVQSQSDAQLAAVINDGKNNMPPFKGSLSPEQIQGLVTHVRQLSPKK